MKRDARSLLPTTTLKPGIPRPLAGTGRVINGHALHVETSTVLLRVKLRRCVLVFMYADGGDETIASGVRPATDPMPVSCGVWIKDRSAGRDVRVRELAPQPLTELVHGLELQPGEFLSLGFNVSPNRPIDRVLVGFMAEVLR
jgi:hypothetical protein